MEECGKEVSKYPVIRSLDSYWNEVKKILNYLKFKSLIKDDLSVGLLVEVLIKAENKWQEEKGELSTVKFSYIKNAAIDILRKKKAIKRYYHPLDVNMSFKTLSQENSLDCKYIIDFVRNGDFTTNQKLIFENYFVNKMSESGIAQELRVNKQYINQVLKIVLNRLREELYVE